MLLAAWIALNYNKCYSCQILFQGFLLMNLMSVRKWGRKMKLRRMKRPECQWCCKKYSFWYSFTLRSAPSESKNQMWPPYVTILLTPMSLQTAFDSQDFWNGLRNLKISVLLCFPLAQSLSVHIWKRSRDFTLWLITVEFLIMEQPKLGVLTTPEL